MPFFHNANGDFSPAVIEIFHHPKLGPDPSNMAWRWNFWRLNGTDLGFGGVDHGWFSQEKNMC
jgi:hypothetical protein